MTAKQLVEEALANIGWHVPDSNVVAKSMLAHAEECLRAASNRLREGEEP